METPDPKPCGIRRGELNDLLPAIEEHDAASVWLEWAAAGKPGNILLVFKGSN